jgi:hypothetical protein
MPIKGRNLATAMVAIYSEPEDEIKVKSFCTVLACKHLGYDGSHGADIRFVPVSDILSVVAMVPFPAGHQYEGFKYVVEKIGLDVASLGGFQEDE